MSILILSIRSSPKAERGAVSVAIAMLLVFIVAAALLSLMKITGSSVVDAATNDEQVAALFLAESGVERAHASLSKAAKDGTYTNTTCTALAALTGASAPSLGRGVFSYDSAVSTPATCGGSGAACTDCTVTVRGTIGSSSRTIRASLSKQVTTNGVEGYGHLFSLYMDIAKDGSQVFTNLAYRAKDAGGSNASVGACDGSLGTSSITTCTTGWDLVGTGIGNVSGMGVFAGVNVGTYNITDTLVDNSGNPSDRNYVQTGVVFKPLGASPVTVVGYYAKKNDTTSTSSTTATLPGGWTCNPSNGTSANMLNAASADTLVYGFSSWPALSTNRLNGFVFGVQPLRNHMELVGTQGDYLYSQIWYSYNPAYYPTGSSGATNGADIVATIGASFGAHYNSGNGRLILDADVTNGVLSSGDIIKNSTGDIIYGTLGTLFNGTAGKANAQYNYTNSSGATPTSSNTSMRAYSTVLKLAANTCKGILTINDSVTDTADAVTYGSLTSLLSGSLNLASSTYQLAAGAATYLPSISTTCGSNNSNVNFHTAGTTITLTGATGSAPLTGTAVAVFSGTGLLNVNGFTGRIDNGTAGTTGTTLTVTAISGTPLRVGDALFGTNVAPNTRITALISGGGTGGTGTYTVTPSQAAASANMIARAAVVSASSANSFVVSRVPTTRLSGGAQLCGGVCTFFFDGTSANSTASDITLSNILNGDDWSSGLACLSGVDPNDIVRLGTIVSSRSRWSEPVK